MLKLGRKRDPLPPYLRHARPNAQLKERDEDGFWSELGDDVREWLVQMDQEKLEDLGRIVKSAGSGLKGAWKQVSDIPKKLLNLPIVKDHVDEDDAERWVGVARTLGTTVGYTAAGGHAVAGAVKFLQGKKRGDKGRLIDGMVDAATAVVIAASVGGLGLARAIAAPIGASLNSIKGGYNAFRGFKEHDQRKQLQGVLDATRSAGTVGRLFSAHSVALKVAGVGLAPIAGALQAGRGMHDLAIGLRNDDNKKELKGLVDIATAVGTAMAFASGVAIIPGVALAVAANLAKVAYQLSPRVRGKMDGWIDKAEPKLEKAVDTTLRWTSTIRKAWRKTVGRWVKAVDAESPVTISRAQLAEITNLFHADGAYTRDERKRLETVLEALGQKSDLPKQDASPPPLRRDELKEEFKEHSAGVDFMRFLLVVADYDFLTTDPEARQLDSLARDLKISPQEMEQLREERAAAVKDDRASETGH